MRILFLLVFLSLGLVVPVQSQVAADRAYDLAAGLHDRGLHERAARSFRAFLERWPDHPRSSRAQFHLADALLRSAAIEESLPFFASYLESGDSEFRRQAFYGQGDALSRRGRHREAAQSFGQAVGAGDDELGQAALHFAAEAQHQAGERQIARALHERLRDCESPVWRRQSRAALAFMAFEDGDYAEASLLYRELVADAQDDLTLDCQLMLARCAVELKDFSAALKVLNNLATGANREQGNSRLCLQGRALAALGQVEAATKVFAEAQSQGAGLQLHQSVLAAASSLHEQKQSAAGLALLAKIPDSSPIANEALYWRGVLAEASGLDDEAITLLRSSLSKADDPNRRYRLADALLRAGRLEEAQAEFERVVATKSVDPRVRDESQYGLGFCLDARGEERRAVAIFHQLNRENVDADLRTESRFAAAESLFKLKDWQAAAEIYPELARASQSKMGRQAAYKLAFCLTELGDREGALSLFLELARAEPSDDLSFDCAAMAGRLQQELGRLGDAAASLTLASRLTADHDQSLEAALAAAAAARAGGDPVAAVAAYQGLSAGIGKDSALAHFGVAASATEAGLKEVAIAAWSVFVGRFPEHELADEGRLNWAWSLKESGELEAALAPLQQPFSNQSLEPERLFLGALVLESLARSEEALAIYRAAAKLAPTGPRAAPALLAAGLIAKDLDQPKAATVDFDHLIANYPEAEEVKVALYERALLAATLESPAASRPYLLTLESQDESGALGRDAGFRLAELDYLEAAYGESIKRYDRLLANVDSAADLRERCHFKRGFAHERLGQLELARADFEALKLSEASFAGDAAFQAGDLAERQGDDAAALTAFERAWKLQPKTALGAAAGRRSMVVLGRLGRSDEVLKLGGQRLDLEARDAWSLLAFMASADASFEKKQYRAARSLYAVVADHGAALDAARARYQMARSLVAEGRTEAAIDAFLAVTIFHDEAQWSARALLAAAELLVAAKQPAKAKTLVDDLLRDYRQEEAAVAAQQLQQRLAQELEEN